MTKVAITEQHLTNIANAIRSKSGSSDTYTPAEMATAITNIPSGGGGSVTLGYDESVSVGNALVGSAVTAEPFYTPSGDIVISGASEYMTNATVELNYSYANSTLTISGVTIVTTKSTPSFTFIGNGANFTIEEVNA